MTMTEDMNEIVSIDRASHPHCQYSIQSSHRSTSSYKNGNVVDTRNNDNNMVYSVIEQVFRHCPNEKPVNIYLNKSFNTSPDGFDDFMSRSHGGTNSKLFSDVDATYDDE